MRKAALKAKKQGERLSAGADLIDELKNMQVSILCVLVVICKKTASQKTTMLSRVG